MYNTYFPCAIEGDINILAFYPINFGLCEVPPIFLVCTLVSWQESSNVTRLL